MTTTIPQEVHQIRLPFEIERILYKKTKPKPTRCKTEKLILPRPPRFIVWQNDKPRFVLDIRKVWFTSSGIRTSTRPAGSLVRSFLLNVRHCSRTSRMSFHPVQLSRRLLHQRSRRSSTARRDATGSYLIPQSSANYSYHLRLVPILLLL